MDLAGGTHKQICGFEKTNMELVMLYCYLETVLYLHMHVYFS